MKINGVELENLDIYDADVAEKFDSELEKLKTVEEKVVGKKNGEAIRIMCTIVFEVFNNLFGEGTDKKIFGEKVNLLTCMKAVEELVEQADEQKKELEKITAKYSPNRAQRRTKK